MTRSRKHSTPDPLDEAVRRLYDVFSAYPRPSYLRPDGATNWESHPGDLITNSLRKLSGDELANYAWRAMTTQGSADDFRYFLPRLLELTAEGLLPVEPWVILGKLVYAGWSAWPKEERQAVVAFARTLAKREVTACDDELFRRGADLRSLLESLEHAGVDLAPVLEYWWTQHTAPAIKNLAALVNDVYFTNKSRRVQSQLHAWLLEPRTRSMLEADVCASLEGADREAVLRAAQTLDTAADQVRRRNAQPD